VNCNLQHGLSIESKLQDNHEHPYSDMLKWYIPFRVVFGWESRRKSRVGSRKEGYRPIPMSHQYAVLRFGYIMKRTEVILSSILCILRVSARMANPDRIPLVTSTEEASRSFIDFLAFNLILFC